ncbi:hypothetical protein U1Q18_033837 [Sarracenia purpurea var. burkii]
MEESMEQPSSTPLPPPPPQDKDQNPDRHEPSSSSPYPSPTKTPSNQNSPKAVQPPISPPKKTHPLPWSHQETVNLIEAYQEKWYSLKRGQLKASQWEEVAITVAARCGYDEPSKTAIQCRHKIEKLRKRYRTEKQKPIPQAWEYFELMDRMDHGPLPISARPMAMIPYQNSNPKDGDYDNDDEEDDDDEDEEEQEVDETKYTVADKRNNKSKSINHIVRGTMSTNSSSMERKLIGGNDRVSRFSQKQLEERFEKYESGGEDEEENNGGGGGEEEGDEAEEEVERGRGMASQLAAEIKAFAERLVRMENKKMEMVRETQKHRMEMENKRMEMILESQRKIVDAIDRAFGSHKKLKVGAFN